MALTTVRPQGMGFNTGRRNLIINGAMQVAQRGTSLSMVHDGTRNDYLLDRYNLQIHSTLDELEGTYAQVSDAPAGFSNSLKWTTTEPEGAIDADHYVSVLQKIEAQNLQHLKNGTADALNTTLSFHVKSSQTGTFGVNLYKEDNTGRVINATYTINSADTWEYKTITFAGDTAGGGIDNNNGTGIWVSWHLAAGTDFDGTNSTSWADYSVTNWAGGHAQDGVITTDNATWQITGVQFEVGENASDFEHRSFDEERRACYRYFFQYGTDGSTGVSGTNNNSHICLAFVNSNAQSEAPVPTPLPMRVQPTVTVSATGDVALHQPGQSRVAASGLTTQDNLSGFATVHLNVAIPSSSNFVHGEVCFFEFNGADKYLRMDAEL